MIRRSEAIACPACSSWTLEWTEDEGSCETCGYGGCYDNADREPAALAILRRWRADAASPGFIGEKESAKILRAIKVENCAMLADLLDVPRMGREVDCAPRLVSVMASSSGGAHLTWRI